MLWPSAWVPSVHCSSLTRGRVASTRLSIVCAKSYPPLHQPRHRSLPRRAHPPSPSLPAAPLTDAPPTFPTLPFPLALSIRQFAWEHPASGFSLQAYTAPGNAHAECTEVCPSHTPREERERPLHSPRHPRPRPRICPHLRPQPQSHPSPSRLTLMAHPHPNGSRLTLMAHGSPSWLTLTHTHTLTLTIRTKKKRPST